MNRTVVPEEQEQLRNTVTVNTDYRLVYASSGIITFLFIIISFYQDLCFELLLLMRQRHDRSSQSQSGPRSPTNHTAVAQAAQRPSHLQGQQDSGTNLYPSILWHP